MDKKQFLAMEITEQVVYINSLMQIGQSLSKICDDLKISKSISGKFKAYNYKLINGQYVLQEGQQEVQGEEITTVKAIAPKEIQKVKRGRPVKVNNKVTRLTIEIDSKNALALKFYLVSIDEYANGYINKLIENSIPEEYFNYK